MEDRNLSKTCKKELENIMFRLKNAKERKEKTISERDQYLARIENIKKKGSLNFGSYFDSSKLSVERPTEKNGLFFASKSVLKTDALREKKGERFIIKGVGADESKYIKALKDNETFLKSKEQEWLIKQQEKQKKEDKENKKKFFDVLSEIELDNEEGEYRDFFLGKQNYMNDNNLTYKDLVNRFMVTQLKKNRLELKKKEEDLKAKLEEKEQRINELKGQVDEEKKNKNKQQFDIKEKSLSKKIEQLKKQKNSRDNKISKLKEKYGKVYKQQQKDIKKLQNMIDMNYKSGKKNKFKWSL